MPATNKVKGNGYEINEQESDRGTAAIACLLSQTGESPIQPMVTMESRLAKVRAVGELKAKAKSLSSARARWLAQVQGRWVTLPTSRQNQLNSC